METIVNIVTALLHMLKGCDTVKIYAPAPKSLPGLPVELLVRILEYLPLSSAALLSLCSQSLWRNLGSNHFELLRRGRRCIDPRTFMPRFVFTEDEEQRNKFFLLLERDSKEMVFCYFCQKLHRPSEQYIHYRKTRCKDYRTAWGDLGNGATFSRLNYAMKQYRQGLNVKDILDPVSKAVTHYQYNWAHRRLFTPRVVSGSLYLRTQHWILLQPKKFLELPRGFYYISLCNHLKDICQDDPENWPLTKILQDRLYEYRQARGNTMCESDIEKCQTCRTEFQVDIKETTWRGKAVVITVWQDFGQISTPFDMTWNAHFFLASDFEELGRTPSFIPGSIKESFECGSFDLEAHQTKHAPENLCFRNWSVILRDSMNE